MSPQYQSALIRGVIAAVVSAGVAFFAGAATGEYGAAAIAAGGAAFGVLAVRFGGEGSYDSARASSGDVHESDVGA